MHYPIAGLRAAGTLLCILLVAVPAAIAATAPESDRAAPFYRLDSDADYRLSFFDATDRLGNHFRIATHRWHGGHDRLAVLVHGYITSCGYMKPVQRWFLSRGYDVLCLELPGHGESSGKPADIPDMQSYWDIYRQVMPQIAKLEYRELVFFAHSTGNIGMIEQLLEGKEHPFRQIIMLTPLIRSALWELSNFAYTLLGGMIESVPRRELSIEDPEFQRLLRMDPRPIEWVPLHWFGELREWNEQLQNGDRRSQEPVHLIFAGNDTVIDTDYNRAFLERRFPNASSYLVSDAGHIVYYAGPAPRRRFFEILEAALRTKKHTAAPSP